MMQCSKDEDAQKENEIDVINESGNPLDIQDVDASFQQLLSNLKIIEKQEADLQDSYAAKYSQLQSEVTLLEREVENGTCKELASVLTETQKLKRKIDSFPVQYELRFSELNGLIQEKHSQTRNLYATYNALLEIKELMLKEISLLNSINSQFHDAIASPAGQMKLIGSMEGILKGTQQRLRKAELEIQKEQKSCDDIKETHKSAVLKQRHFHSLLKIFQEECTNNERLRTAQTST